MTVVQHSTYLQLAVGFPSDVHGVIDVLAAGGVDAHGVQAGPSKVPSTDNIRILHPPLRVFPPAVQRQKIRFIFFVLFVTLDLQTRKMPFAVE